MNKKYDVYGIDDIGINLHYNLTNQEFKNLNIIDKTELNTTERNKILGQLLSKKFDTKISGYVLKIFKALSCLGIKTTINSKIGLDEFGFAIQKELEKTRIDLNLKSGMGCSSCKIIFENNKEIYSKKKHEGISKHMSYEDINIIKLKESKTIILTSEMFSTDKKTQITKFVTRISKENNVKIVFLINNINYIIKSQIAKKIISESDILISPFENAYLLYNESNKIKLLNLMGKTSAIKILITAKEFLVSKGNTNLSISKTNKKSKYEHQFFCAGFLFGFLEDYGLEKSAIIGSYLAGKEKIDDSILDELHQLM